MLVHITTRTVMLHAHTIMLCTYHTVYVMLFACGNLSECVYCYTPYVLRQHQSRILCYHVCDAYVVMLFVITQVYTGKVFFTFLG